MQIELKKEEIELLVYRLIAYMNEFEGLRDMKDEIALVRKLKKLL